MENVSHKKKNHRKNNSGSQQNKSSFPQIINEGRFDIKTRRTGVKAFFKRLAERINISKANLTSDICDHQFSFNNKFSGPFEPFVQNELMWGYSENTFKRTAKMKF